MFEGLGEGALVAALVVVVLREVLGYFKSRADATQFDNMKTAVYKTLEKTRELHTWHDKEDGEGRKIWYGKRSLEEAVENLAENLSDQTKVFSRFIDKLDAIEETLIELKRNRNG